MPNARRVTRARRVLAPSRRSPEFSASDLSVGGEGATVIVQSQPNVVGHEGAVQRLDRNLAALDFGGIRGVVRLEPPRRALYVRMKIGVQQADPVRYDLRYGSVGGPRTNTVFPDGSCTLNVRAPHGSSRGARSIATRSRHSV